MRGLALLPLLAAGFAGGCDAGGPVAVPVPNVIAPLAVEVPNLPVGRPSSIEIRVFNRGLADARLELEVTEPFQLPADRLLVPAGRERDVLLVLSPEVYEPIAGTLTIREGGRPLRVALAVGVTADADGDGRPALAAGGDDCDDEDPGVAPGLPEIEDGTDQDCDLWVDEDFVQPGDLLVTEIHLEPFAGPDAAWVEIVNRSARPIVLDHLEVAGPTGLAFLEGGLLDIGERALLCGPAAAWTCVGPLPPGLALGGSFEIRLDRPVESLNTSILVSQPGVAWELRASALAAGQNDTPELWCPAENPLPLGERGTPRGPPSCD